MHNPQVAIEPWQLQTTTIQWLPHSTAFSKLVPGEAYDKRQSGKRLPDQLQHVCCFCWFGDICNQWWQPICKWIAALEKTKTTTPSKRSLCCHWLLHPIYWKKNPCQVRQKKRDCKINVIIIFPIKRSPIAWISDCVPTSWRFLALIPWGSTLSMGVTNISERATWKIIHQWSGRVADHETNPRTLNCGRHTRDSMYYYPMCKHQNRCQGFQALQSLEDEMFDLIFISPAKHNILTPWASSSSPSSCNNHHGKRKTVTMSHFSSPHKKERKQKTDKETDRIETHRDGWTPEQFQRARAASPSLLQLVGMPTITDPLSPTISLAKHNILTPWASSSSPSSCKAKVQTNTTAGTCCGNQLVVEVSGMNCSGGGFEAALTTAVAARKRTWTPVVAISWMGAWRFPERTAVADDNIDDIDDDNCCTKTDGRTWSVLP